MSKYRVTEKSLINYPLPLGPIVHVPGDVVELPDGVETSDNLELLVDQNQPVTKLHR